jgi:hypothetical protein
MKHIKSVAILVVSIAVIGFVVKYCFLPPRRMADYVLGDGKCDLCGERAVYELIVADRYLGGEYCARHRWMGVINSEPMSKGIKVLLGAAVFGVIYAVVSILAGQDRELDSDVADDSYT